MHHSSHINGQIITSRQSCVEVKPSKQLAATAAFVKIHLSVKEATAISTAVSELYEYPNNWVACVENKKNLFGTFLWQSKKVA